VTFTGTTAEALFENNRNVAPPAGAAGFPQSHRIGR